MKFHDSTYKHLRPGQEVATTGEILAFAAATFPDKTGLICGTRKWTFGELDHLANQFAHALIALFARHEGPIGIIGANSAEYALAHFGTSRTGRYTINFPTRCTEEDLVYTVNLTKPAALVVGAGYGEIIEKARGRFEKPPIMISIGGGEPSRGRDFWDFVSNQPQTPPAIEINPNAHGSLIFTGGTTGRPKAVLASQRARAISAMAAVEDFRIESDTVAGYSVPFTHTAGLYSWFQPAVLAGCTGVIIPKWDPELFMQAAEQHGINMIFAVPAQLALLLNHPAFDPQRLRSLQRIIFGGAPLSRALIERAEQAMPWMSCGRAYGSTETGHLAAQIKSDRDKVYDGYNQPGGRLEIEIFKEPGVVAAEGEIGEVATRGSHLMTEYLGDREATDVFFRPHTSAGDWGWMGDLAVRNNGYFTLIGRSKHMILSGGLNIFPAELEEVLLRHPDVADCIVFGIQDAVWGELPAAAVVPRGNWLDTEKVLAYVAEGVARYKRLRKIYVLDEIPRTGAGKAQIHLIKEQCLKLDAALPTSA
ncbi:MAG: long-chain fatty acid--CoA ligase [Xanthobacteraceae bacterium]|nr:MAG: long-chain fatty acid--CoA ligase [Xanthobacteraceae bacterium]